MFIFYNIKYSNVPFNAHPMCMACQEWMVLTFISIGYQRAKVENA